MHHLVRRWSSGLGIGDGDPLAKADKDPVKDEDDNLVFSWGWGGNGQLGLDDEISRIAPQVLPSLVAKRVCQVACGSRFTLACTTTGGVYSWGKGDDGQLGHGDKRLLLRPQLVEELEGLHVGQVAARGSHSLALTVEGRVYAWGRGDEGQLGHSPLARATMDTSVPHAVEALAGHHIEEIACGRVHSLARTRTEVFSWGCGEDGALGHGLLINVPEPMAIQELDEREVVQMACGSRHNLAVTLSGFIYAWGWGIYGQLGLGDTQNALTPVVVPALAHEKVQRVCCGFRHSLAVTRHRNDEGTILLDRSDVYAWGWQQYGQLGLQNNGNGGGGGGGEPAPARGSQAATIVHTPTLVRAMRNVKVQHLAAGGRHTVAVLHSEERGVFRRNNMTTYAFGRGDDGQLGIGHLHNSAAPVTVSQLSRRVVDAVACGWAHSVAVAQDFPPGAELLRVNTLERARPWYNVARWLCLGDLDGIFANLLSGIVQLMLVVQCQTKCGFSDELVYGQILPAVASTYLLGGFFFAGQARRLGNQERRHTVTALPHGVNTVIFFAYIQLIMAPEYRRNKSAADAYQAGLFAAFATGAGQAVLSLVVRALQRVIPRAALLSSMAGVSLTFLSMGFALEIFQQPSVALLPMMVIIIVYGSGVRLPLRLPGVLVALLLGVGCALLLAALRLPYFVAEDDGMAWDGHVRLPALRLDALHAALTGSVGWKYAAVFVPMTIVNVVCNLANVDSAATTGDNFDVTQSMLADAVITMICAALGSPFPSGIYMGHPSFKAMGARSGFIAFSGLLLFALGIWNGTALILKAVPAPSGVGFLLWIGITITAQAFERDARSNSNHSCAVAFGLLPALAAWGLQQVQGALLAAEQLGPDHSYTLSDVMETMTQTGLNPYGMMALSQGYLLTALLYSSMLVHVIEREFLYASGWMLLAAIAAFCGAIHSFELVDNNVDPKFGLPAGDYAVQYAAVYTAVALLLLALYVQEHVRSGRHVREKLFRNVRDQATLETTKRRMSGRDFDPETLPLTGAGRVPASTGTTPPGSAERGRGVSPSRAGRRSPPAVDVQPHLEGLQEEDGTIVLNLPPNPRQQSPIKARMEKDMEAQLEAHRR